MASTIHIDLPIDDDDVVEVGRGNSGENSGPWPHRNESLFITLMDEEVKTKNSKITGTFTKQAWNRLRDQMNEKTQYQYNAHQLRNKYNQLRIMFNKFTSLLKHTGVGWDSQRLTILCTDDVWEALYKVNTHAKRFRKKGMVYYHELSRILGDTSATGKLAFPSTKSPSESSASSDPEFKVKNEELDALQIDSDNDNGDGQGKGKGKGKSKSKMGGKKSKKRSSFQANISEALKEMSENSKRKVDLMEKRFTSASVTTVGDDSGSFEGGSTPSRSLLKECMALLHGMEEIPAAAYTKVVNKLASDPIIREVFVDMPASRMRDWVLNL
ncbi:L10-interacting MYB domain-containing protein [Camellia lanceoleosa]|uniref:L10-interacting MYB domain-containing protein n=1 Tax=Camellia lanceoleosa TaxID=1840588 RepID=A0ACC0I5C2_9ERIC|nr:L10-interacting MYB domain-containing protein [Camellia lanceoleosa]